MNVTMVEYQLSQFGLILDALDCNPTTRQVLAGSDENCKNHHSTRGEGMEKRLF